MFANTITITVGETPRVLNRVNQDNYSSEYALFLADREYNLKVRHQKIAPRNGSPTDQHNVLFSERIYGVEPAPDVVRESSFTLRNPRNDDKALAEDTATGIIDWLSPANVLSLFNWES